MVDCGCGNIICNPYNHKIFVLEESIRLGMKENTMMIICGILLIILITTAYIVLINIPEINWQQTYDKCCGGEVCSDTYYNNKTNECVNTITY